MKIYGICKVSLISLSFYVVFIFLGPGTRPGAQTYQNTLDKYVIDWIKDIIVERQSLCRKDNARDNNNPTLSGERSGDRSGGGFNKRRHPFDQGGMIENWKEIFGVRGRKFWWILWCMPISHERSGNGIDQFVCQPSQHNKGRYTPIHV